MAMPSRLQGQVAFLLLLEGGLGFVTSIPSRHSWAAQEHCGREQHLLLLLFQLKQLLRNLYSRGGVVSASQGCWSSSNLQERAVKGLLVRHDGGYSVSAQ